VKAMTKCTPEFRTKVKYISYTQAVVHTAQGT